MSVTIKIDHAHKHYGSSVIISDLSLKIREGEFFTLLGPSGCGKTTLLRMIAGFNSIEGGDFYFNDTRINDIDPSKRRIGMVFQNYAIFPHLSVRENVMFGLKNQPKKLPKAEMTEQTEKFMKLMHIDEYADGDTERGKAMRKTMCEKFKFASLGFQTVDGVIGAIGMDKCKLCTYCWNGKE